MAETLYTVATESGLAVDVARMGPDFESRYTNLVWLLQGCDESYTVRAETIYCLLAACFPIIEFRSWGSYHFSVTTMLGDVVVKVNTEAHTITLVPSTHA